MFDQIQSSPPPPSQRSMMVLCGGYFAIFLSGMAIAFFRWLHWFHWFRPMSLSDEMITGVYIVGAVLSGVFLLTVKSARPESYRWRLIALLLLAVAPQLINAFLR
jgi:hypothetical protein